MHSKNYWIRSGSYAMAQRIAASLFGFFSYIILVRYFSVDDFGVWTLYVVVSGAAEMSRSAFIQNAFVKFFNEGENRSTLFTSSLFLNFLSTGLFIIILLSLIPLMQRFWHSEVIGQLILWYCATSLVLILFTQLNYLEQANHSFEGVFWSSIVRQGSFFVIVLVTYFFVPGLSLAFFAASQFLGAILGLGVSYLITRRLIMSPFQLDMEVVKKLFKFGKYILGTGLTSTIGKNADQVILGGVSHDIVALYNASVRICNLIEIPSLSVSNIVYPKIAERAYHGAVEVGLLYEKSVGTILGIILPVILGVALFPEWVLTITAGTRYVHASGTLRIMALASLLLPFNIQVGSVCEVMGKPHISFYINLVSNLLNLVMNLFLIKVYGAIGAAWALAVTLIFIFVIGQYYINMKWGIVGLQAFFRIVNFYKLGLSMALRYLRIK